MSDQLRRYLLLSFVVTSLPVCLTLLATDTLADSPTIDGRFEGAAEGYTGGYSILLNQDNDKQNDPNYQGQLWLHEDTNGDVSIAFLLPETLKDNVYGDSEYQSFQKLTGSDKVVFDLFNSGGGLETSDLALDYLHGTPDKNDGPTFISGFTGSEGSSSSPPTNAIAAATSMEYNFNQSNAAQRAMYFGKDKESPSAGDFPEWVFQTIFEFKVTADAFGDSGLVDITSQLQIADVHFSPEKEGFNLDDENPPYGGPLDPGGGMAVPEPSSLALATLGLFSLAGYSYRRKRCVGNSRRS